ncbi:MAG: hypothetical protein V4587_14790 [Acidobacteriota bacterium]
MSIFLHDATGIDETIVIESEWTAKNGNQRWGGFRHCWNCPTHAKKKT